MICIDDNAISVKYVNKKNQRRLWDTQKNIGAAEKWAQKNEEQEKKIKKDKKQIILKIKLMREINTIKITAFFLLALLFLDPCFLRPLCFFG